MLIIAMQIIAAIAAALGHPMPAEGVGGSPV